mmetsp:Transcript_15560/g.34632  ORF Transcript_15560/g.34632 Transcript_15560/m.34632 type:complete len:548 (-) Transcript_15560:58-1701(-)
MEGMQNIGHPQLYPSHRTSALQPGPAMAPGPVMHGAHHMQTPMAQMPTAQMPMAQMPTAQMPMPGPAGTQAYQLARNSMPAKSVNHAGGPYLTRDGHADFIATGHDGMTQGGMDYAAAQGGVYASTPAPYELEQEQQVVEEPVRVSMVVPEGAMPGTKLQYSAPDGQELRLTVPEGVPPGSVMTLTQDPVTGQWKCMAEPVEDPEDAQAAAPAPPTEHPTYTPGAPTIASYPAGHGPICVPRTYVQQPATVNLSYVPPPVSGNASLSMPGQVLGPAGLAMDPARFNPPRQMPGYPGGETMLDQRPSYTPPPVTVMGQRPSYTPLPGETMGGPAMQMVLGPHGEMGLMASTAAVQPQQLPPHVVLGQTPSYVPPPVTMIQNRPSYVPPEVGTQGTQMAQGAPVRMLPPQYVTAPGQPPGQLPMAMMGQPMAGMPPQGMVGAPPMMPMVQAAMPMMSPAGLPPQVGPPPPMGQMTGPGYMMQGHPAPPAYMGPPMGQAPMTMHHQLPPGMVPYGGPMPQQMQMMRPGPLPPEGMEGMPMQGMMQQPSQA